MRDDNRAGTEEPDDLAALAEDIHKKSLRNTREVDTEDIEDILSEPLPTPVHAQAIEALTRKAMEEDDVGGELVDPLETLLGRPSLKSEIVLRCLRQIAGNDPVSVGRLQGEMIDRIGIDDGEETQAATGCCVELVQYYPEDFYEHAPLFAALLDVDNPTTRKNAEYVLCIVAEEYPEEVLPAVREAVDKLEEEPPNSNITSFLGKVTQEYPDATVEHVDTVEKALEEAEDDVTEANLVGIIADVAKDHPGRVADSVDEVGEYLTHDDRTLRYNACSLLERVSDSSPRDVEPFVEELMLLLGDEDEGIRLKAVYTLGEMREERALDRLEDLSSEDPSKEVRELAEKAVHRIR